MIKVQAEAVVHLAQKRGEPVPDALLAIRDAGREASRNYARPWKRCARTAAPRRTGSTRSRTWCSGRGRPVWPRR
ncbi:hypothetical protein NKG94_51375 [Micromonospora sp. M12]